MMKTITVKGVGKLSVKPDWIEISVKLETEAEEYEKTMESAAQRIALLTRSLEEIGFKKEAVKTTDFRVRTDYEAVRDKDGNHQSVFKGYVCTHHVKIAFDFDTKRLAQVLSAISASLVKPEFYISFTVKDPAAVREGILKSAAQNAREKAEILCAASGVMLGGLVSIHYGWEEADIRSVTDYKIEGRCLRKAEVCLSDINIEPEDIDASDTATFVWEICDGR